jgi:very-short-patch-repair endonuclease
LEEMGLSFLRFSDREGRNNINKVLKEIENHIVAYHEMRRS